METNQRQSVSRRYGRRYCKRHGLVYTPLYSPLRPGTAPKTYGFEFTAKTADHHEMDEMRRIHRQNETEKVFDEVLLS